MANINLTDRYLTRPPPQAASKELREWLREEFERMSLVLDAALELVDRIRSTPKMLLAGDVDDFNLDTIDSFFVNYTQDAVTGIVPIDPDPVLGTITIPEDGLYNLKAYCYGFQNSIVQNESIRLILDIDAVIVPVASFDVATNQTADRSFSATFTRALLAGNVVKMGMDATGDLGLFEVFQTSLEIVLALSDPDEDLSRIGFYP